MANTRKEESLSLEQTKQFTDFLVGLNQYGMNGTYSPQSQQRDLIQLNNNPLTPSYDKIIKALSTAPYDIRTLAGYSEFMEVFDTIYGSTIRYFSNLLSFDIRYQPYNMKDNSERKSEEYKSDLKIVEKALRNLDYKQEFAKILKEVLRRETSYVWFRNTRSGSCALQIMPQSECRLSGYFNNSNLLYDFNMGYFMTGQRDINLFDPSFKKKLVEISSPDNKSYIPSTQLSNRDGVYGQWVQCNPEDGAWAFKMDISNFRQVPAFSSLMKSTFDNTTIEKLQKDKDIASAYALLIGEIKTFDNAKGGTEANQFVIDPKVMANFLSLIQSGLQKNIKPVALPLEENKFAQFSDVSPKMASYKLNESASQGASASSLIYNDGKMAQFEMQQAVETDFAFMSQLYPQFASMLNFFINKKTRKYKFEFAFSGLNRQFYRDSKLKTLTQMATSGIVLDECEWASVVGMKPQMFIRSMENAHFGNFTSLLTPLLNLNTTSGNIDPDKKEVGNQELDTDELTDSGADSQDYG